MKQRIVLIALLITVGVLSGQAQTQAVFQVPITVTNGSSVQVLTIGVSGDGPGGAIQDNSIGADTDPSFGAYQELVAPPTPPPPFEFDARILTIPGRVSTFPTGLGGGVYKDFRGFDNAAQVDSFRINISGDGIDARETVISWPPTVATYGTTWTIKPQSGGEWGPVDMLTTTTATIPTGALQRNTLIIKTGALTGVRQLDKETPDHYSLEQNYPNPFNPSTKIQFSLKAAGPVSIKLYNMLGQEVATLVNEVMSPGTYSVPFVGSTVASGMYLYKLETTGFSSVKKMLLVK